MKRPGKALLLLLLLAINASLFWQIKKEHDGHRLQNNNFIVRILYDQPLDSLGFFGIDKNGADILIGTFPEFQNEPTFKEVLLFSPWEKTYKQMSFHLHLKVPRNHHYAPPVDVNGDGRAEIPFFWIEGKRVQSEIRNFAGKVLSRRELEPLSLPIPSDNISWSAFAITDIDLDGRLEILAMISGEFFGLPRGIAAYDLETGRIKWDYLFGATPFQAEAVDIDGDGRKEIIFSAWAPHNGIAYNGMNDDTSYLGVLDCTGRLLWLRETGGYFSEVYFAVADFDRDGRAEIVTARACHRQVDPDRGQLEVLRADTGKVSSALSKSRVSYSRPFIHDVHSSPGPEVVVGDSSGMLTILNSKLQPLKQIAVGEPVEVLGLHPVGKTDAPLIIARVGSGGSRLYDLSLNMVHANPPKKNPNAGISILSISKGKSRHLLLKTDQLYLISRNPNSHFLPAAIIFSRFSLFLAWTLAFNALFFLWWREKAKKQVPERKRNRDDSGWLTVTQEMVHRMKTPMTNILWEAEQLKTGLENVKATGALSEAIRKTPDSLIGELKELKLMNRYLMKFLQIQSPKFKIANLNSLLREIAEKYSRHLQGRIRFDLILDKNIPRLEVDEEQIAEVFVNIIENAIDALPDGGELEISSRWQPKNPKGAEIVFRDNGKGIDENQLTLIFTPNYTTKKEGFGIGLPVCQRIVAAHGGTIAVESQVGIGTRIAIFIPGGTSATGKNE